MKNGLNIRLLIFIVLAVVNFSLPATAAELAFTLDAPTNKEAEARAIAGQLEVLGIDVTVKIWSRSELNRLIKSGTRTAYLTDWGSAFFEPFDLAQPKLSTRARGNFSFYSNKRVDALFSEASTETDFRIRNDLYKQIQHIILDQSPWVFGYILPRADAASRKVRGYLASMDGQMSMHDVSLADGDTMKVAVATDAFETLDPAMHRDRATEAMLRNMFDGLVTRTSLGGIVVQMAKSWKNPEPTVYEFTLRDKLFFHNGDPVTAEDVAYTFQRILTPFGINGKTSPRRSLLGPLDNVVALDKKRVRFILSKPFPVFMQSLAHFQIVPKNYIQKVGAKAFAKKPIGCGPFRFDGGSLKQGIRMKRFEQYYGGSPRLIPVAKAKLKELIMIPVGVPRKRVSMLRNGEIQLAQSIPLQSLQPLTKLDFAILMADGTRSHQMELNNVRPPFNDIRVRKALNMIVDWKTILHNLHNGKGRRLATCFLPSGLGFDSTLKPQPHNPHLAVRLLKSAGYDVKMPK